MNNLYNNTPVYAVISDNADPDSLGRVKATVNFLGDPIETDWIHILTPYNGSFFLPEIGDQVVIGFMENSNDPIVLGEIWSNEQTPPESQENSGSDLNKDGENNLHFIKSRSGHMLILDEKSGEEKIQIVGPDQNTRLEFQKADSLIKFESDVDLSFVTDTDVIYRAKTIECKFSNSFKISSEETAIESKSADSKIESSADLTFEAPGITFN